MSKGGANGVNEDMAGNQMTWTHGVSCLVKSDFLRRRGLYPARLLYLWKFSRQEYWNS